MRISGLEVLIMLLEARKEGDRGEFLILANNLIEEQLNDIIKTCDIMKGLAEYVLEGNKEREKIIEAAKNWNRD